MKSKKIIALALTAAIAISAASMTAFAKTVTYSTETANKNPEQLVATVTLKEGDLKKETRIVAYKAKEKIGATDSGFKDSSGNPADIAQNAEITATEYEKLKGAKDKFTAVEEEVKYFTINDLGLKKFDRTITKQQYGWAEAAGNTTPALSNNDYTDTLKGGSSVVTWATDADPAAKDKVIDGSKKFTVGPVGDKSGKYDYVLTNNATTSTDELTLYYVAVGRTDTDDDNIAKNKEALDKAAGKAASAASREEQLKKLDAENGALDNVNTGSGVETQKAKVTGRTAAADVAEVHDLKVAGLDADLSNLAWVYQVTAPDGLIKGRTARAQLELPDGYTTTGYKVAVYHIKGWCSAEKVKGVSVGTNDVAFWANDFSPYILVLTPSDAIAGTSTGNPSTGDFSAVPVAMLAAAALSATGFVAYKKRKAE